MNGIDKLTIRYRCLSFQSFLFHTKRLRDQRSEREKQREDRQAERERRNEEQKRWLKDQEAEREKRAEERFQAVVVGLGSKDVEARAGAAIMLRTFLRPGYEQFYYQTFDLAVAHLRLRHVDSKKPEPLDSLSQALVRVFTESAELVREEREKLKLPEYNRYLDASNVRLDRAYLARTRLQKVWFREAYFIGTNLHGTQLQETDLIKVDFSNADLEGADLSRANLRQAVLSHAILRRVNLMEVDLYGANLSNANLGYADLTGASLYGADLTGTNIEEAKSLIGTNLRQVKGLVPKQLERCEARGAVIDAAGKDDTEIPTQPGVTPPMKSL